MNRPLVDVVLILIAADYIRKSLATHMKFYLPVISLLVFISCVSSKPVAPLAKNPASRPKLIVGITVDQMRYDYIERYWNDFSEGGFKRLVNDGFFCRNLKYNYMPTYTGPGHASIFTGTTPCFHGIIENDWFERSTGLTIYCSSDSTVQGVGTSGKAGQMSPHYLTASTLGDMLKLFSNEKSKVFGIAMKDRGAILPAGRMADGAYWFVGADEGVWATSSWYMNELPSWVNEFNADGKASEYSNSQWTMLKEASEYGESHPDNNAYETPFRGTLRPVFPYDLRELKATNGNFDIIKATPFGNSMTLDFAKSLMKNEQLGSDEITDMLCMSFSATDYVGHQFGIHSIETQDCYLRLDLLLADYLNYLDQEIGKDNYLIFLSADHGGVPTPSYITKKNGVGGYWKSDALEIYVEDQLSKKYGTGDWIINESNQNIFLNRELMATMKVNLKEAQYEVANMILTFPEIQSSFTSNDLAQYRGGTTIKEMVQNGFSQAQSGDVIYVLKPGYIEYGMTGTTHGAPFVYDSHVPAIFYGSGVKKGESFAPYNITDIAPTISSICRLPLTDACSGSPIIEAIPIK